MSEPVIINGTHQSDPIGRFLCWDGSVILVWTKSEVPAAVQAAIGPLPTLTLATGGEMEVVKTNAYGHPVEVQYNPSGDATNAALGAAFASTVQAWNARVAAIQALALKLMEDK